MTVAKTYIRVPQIWIRKMLPTPLKEGQRIRRVKVSDLVTLNKEKGRRLLRMYGRVVTITGEEKDDPVVIEGWHYPTYKGILGHS